MYTVRWTTKKHKAWRVAWEWYEEGIRRSTTVKEAHYGDLGISPKMTKAQAQKVTVVLNLDNRKTRIDKRREVIRLRMREIDAKEVRHLPSEYVRHFEEELGDLPDVDRRRQLWRKAKALIQEVDIPIRSWRRRRDAIYKYFQEHRHKPAYAKKVIAMLNRWLEFYNEQMRTDYRPIPPLRGHARGRVEDASGEDKTSDGLTEEDLAKAKTMAPRLYKWLYISLWFGLRPVEVDQLLRVNRKRWYFEGDIFHVYQTKTRKWKEIPILFSQQRKAIHYIREAKFKRPSPDTIKHHTGGYHHTNAGRHGFTYLMWRRKRSIIEVTSWMGHDDINLTFRIYSKLAKKARLVSGSQR